MKFKEEQLIEYFETRGVFIFNIFLLICIIGLLPVDNFLFDIFSHFKFQYIIFGTILLLIFLYLSIKNKKYLIYCLILILLITINIIDVFQYIGKRDFSTITDIKIGLYNLYSSNTQYNEFLEQIKTENPDIIILQEINNAWQSHIEKIKEKYPYNITYTREDNFGISLYSKKELEKAETELWTKYDIPIIKTNIKIKNKKITLYCIHTLPPINGEYFSIRNQMLEKLSKIPAENTIIAGDLNTTIYSKSYKKYINQSKFLDSQIQSKNIQGTWNAKYFAFLRISLEHILISPEFQISEFKIGKYFNSDHLPIYVGIKIK